MNVTSKIISYNFPRKVRILSLKKTNKNEELSHGIKYGFYTTQRANLSASM